jgi:signal transduction histidine kinase/ActR/RegA family two-component response regulator
LLTTQADGLIVHANHTFCQWIGYTAADLIGKLRFQDLLTTGGRIFHQTHWAPLLHMQRSVAEVKLDLRHQRGHLVPTLINAVRRQGIGGTSDGAGDGDGISGGACDTVFDDLAVMVVTERHRYESELLLARQNAERALEDRRQAEQALSAADHRKDVFLATLAHELRNPLAPMGNIIELLRQKDLTDPQLIWARDVFERQVQHMTHLVDDLLEVSRITQGKLALRKEVVALTDVLSGAVEASRFLLQSATHELTLSFPSEPLLLDADPTRLSQMIQNLLNNAAKYTPPGGKIWLTAARGGASEAAEPNVVITVRDSGIGIAKEHLDSVFDMFSQLGPALNRSQGGLGIGLSLVRALAELHGGSISASSDGVGHGSTFTLRLPIVTPPTAISKIAAPASHDVKTRKILIVDDNEDAAISLAMVLEMSTHQVQTAYDGETGFARAETFGADVIILDIGLPDITGYALAQRIRQTAWGKHTPLLALTGWGQYKDKQAAMRAGFNHHFTKPVDFERLLKVIDLHGNAADIQS